jgi:hypothetical protein
VEMSEEVCEYIGLIVRHDGVFGTLVGIPS